MWKRNILLNVCRKESRNQSFASCMHKIIVLLLLIGLNWIVASAAPAEPLHLPGGKDTLSTDNAASEAGVKIKKLNVPASEFNPNVHQAARWDTVDLDMYHVDMTNFRDTLSYTLHHPSTGQHFHPPHVGRVTSGFGPRRLYGRKFHKGIDIDLETGDEVQAAMAGKVRIARYSRGYGNFVVISHEGGLETLYGHMSELVVNEGELVEAGQMIGLGGSTGQSTGSHLHFELRIFGEQVDPLLAIDPATLMPRHADIKVDATWFDHILRAKGTHFHIVEEGETLETICAMYEMEPSELLELNELEEEVEISAGVRLKLD